jgi:hypothetical protein
MMARNPKYRAERLGGLVAVLAILAMTGAMAQPASGETVYRCGPEGRSYSTTPCPGGKTVDAADPRSEEQQRQARDTAQRERQLADKMSTERAQREKAIVPAAAGNLGPQAKPVAPAAKPAKPASKPKKQKKGRSKDPTLSDPVHGITPKK